MTKGIPILVVNDDPPIRRLLRTSLRAQGYEVLEAPDAATAFDLLSRRRPEVMILDLGLPDVDGTDIIREVRTAGDKTPIIVLSSRGNERGKVEALDLGADDYVTKPFGMAELVARIRAAQRHNVQQRGANPIFRSGELTVDLTRRRVTRAGEEIKLSPKEYDILRLLVLHAGRVLTHRMIMQELWGAAGDVQYLRIYIRQIRQKLETNPHRPELIMTETGVGYRLVEETALP